MLRCIRFGEVLLDESFRTFLICNQCQTEFVEVPEFRVHLATTSCGKRLFEEEVIGLKFGAAQVSRTGKDKTYLLYNPADVQLTTTEPVTSSETHNDSGDDAYLDLIKIEEELLDPRWYTDIANAQPDVGSPQTGNSNKPMEYKELVEAVGPYVQFKESASKENPSGVMVRRFPNKTSSPKAVVKNAILPVKSHQSTNQPSMRLLNPAAKRKLDLAPKQVQFNDTVNVKYVTNEKLSTDVNENKQIAKRNSEQYESTDSATFKRRKTINAPMVQTSVHPDKQKKDVKRNSEVPKTTVGPTVVRNTAARTTSNTVTTKLAAKPNNISSVAADANIKPIAPAKSNTTSLASQTIAQAHIKTLVPNPVIAQTQINGTKNQANTSKQVVKNPVTYKRFNSNGMKTASGAKPQQRTVSVTTTSASQPAIYAPSSQFIPPALASLSCKKVCNPAVIAAVKAGVDAHQQTNDILSKLQTRGLQVKRTQPPIPATTNTGQQNKTMELLQKLQSKGMKVKVLNGKEAAAFVPAATVTHLNASIVLPTTAPNEKIVNNVGNMTTAFGKPTKTILNNKLIIRKVN